MFQIIFLFLAFGHTLSIDLPNIILILADDLGFNDIGYNNADVITPHINELAANGVILDKNYAQPFCTPSRSALLSGMYPYKIGMQVDRTSHTKLRITNSFAMKGTAFRI